MVNYILKGLRVAYVYSGYPCGHSSDKRLKTFWVTQIGRITDEFNLIYNFIDVLIFICPQNY
jgi:hypothetical protein